MIEGFEEHTHELTDDEKKLIPIIIRGLSNHKGKERSITGSTICKNVSEKFMQLTEPRLRKIINFIRARKILPVIATSNGYYVSDSPDEIRKQIRSLEQRRDAIQKAIDGLNQFL